MKTGLLIFCGIFLVNTLTAQRNMDLSVEIISPHNNDTIQVNVPTNLQITITNNGPEDFLLTDSLYVYQQIDGMQVFFSPGNSDHQERTNLAIPAGNTYSFNVVVIFSDQYADSDVTWCITLLPVNSVNPIAEMNATDNTDCVTLHFASASSAGLDEVTQETGFLFPNPAKDWVQFSSEVDSGRINLVSLDGKMAVEKELVNNRLNVRDLPEGIYFVSFYVQGFPQVLRLAVTPE